MKYNFAERILATKYGFRAHTKTYLGIDKAVSEFNENGTVVPQIMIVITDGLANGGGSVLASSNAAR